MPNFNAIIRTLPPQADKRGTLHRNNPSPDNPGGIYKYTVTDGLPAVTVDESVEATFDDTTNPPSAVVTAEAT